MEEKYEPIKIIEAWGLDFNSGSAYAYAFIAGVKEPEKTIEYLQSALWYIKRQMSYAFDMEMISNTNSYYFCGKDDYDLTECGLSEYLPKIVAEKSKPGDRLFEYFCENLFYGHWHHCANYLEKMIKRQQEYDELTRPCCSG